MHNFISTSNEYCCSNLSKKQGNMLKILTKNIFLNDKYVKSTIMVDSTNMSSQPLFFEILSGGVHGRHYPQNMQRI